MEFAGLGISIVSLAQLFQTTVDSFGYVELGKNFSYDYQTSCLKLDNTQLQLTRWGQAVGLCISEADAEAVESSSLGIPQQHRAKVERLLGHIVNLFKQAETLGSVYESRSSSANVDGDGEEPRTAIGSLHLRMERICISRQQRISRRKKLKWAVYDKQRFESLVNDVRTHVDDLIKTYPPPPAEERQICEQEVDQLRDEPALPVLREIVASQDHVLEDAIARLDREPRTAIQNNWNNATGTKVLNQGTQYNYGGQHFSL